MQISDQSQRFIWDSRRNDFCFDEECPWARCGLPDPRRETPLARRLLLGFCFFSACLAMSLAVLTIHGWMGLLVHGIALSGATGLLQRAAIQPRLSLEPLDSPQGDGVCASANERI